MSFRMRRPKKAPPGGQAKSQRDKNSTVAEPSFGALGVLPPGKSGVVSGESQGLRDMSSALGNQAMGSLLSGVVKGGRDGALPPGVEGPAPLPKVQIPPKPKSPKELTLEERFDRFIAPFLARLLHRIEDPERRAWAVKQVGDNLKGGVRGWLEQGLDDSGLDDMEKEEIKRRYEDAKDQEWWAPP